MHLVAPAYVGYGVGGGAGVGLLAGRHTPHVRFDWHWASHDPLSTLPSELHPHVTGMHSVVGTTCVHVDPLGHGYDDEPWLYNVHNAYVHCPLGDDRVHANGAGGAGVGGGVGPKLGPHSTASVKLPCEVELYPSTLTR